MAVFSAVATLVSIGVVRFGFLEMRPAMATWFGALALAGVSILLALAGFAAIWQNGSRGIPRILLALLMSIGFDRIWSALETDTRKAAEEAAPEALVEQKDYSDDPESAIAEYSGAEAGPPSPSHIVANIVLVAIVIFGAVQAAEILNFAIISAWLARVLEIGGNILFGASIILVGLFIARFVAALVAESGGPRAELTATVTRYGVSLLAVVIGLTQMGLGDNIVRWGFLIVLAGISLAFGIAFGVGGREAAARLLKRLQDDSETR